MQFADAPPEHPLPPWAGAGFVHVRVLVPPPQLAEHELQPDQPPWTGHGWVLQLAEDPPEQSLPAHARAGLSHARCHVPPPHEAGHASFVLILRSCRSARRWLSGGLYEPQAPHWPCTLPHAADCDAPPVHALPWHDGAGLLQLRVRVFEHPLQPVQPAQPLHCPCTVGQCGWCECGLWSWGLWLCGL